jgi:hypothetical protein
MAMPRVSGTVGPARRPSAARSRASHAPAVRGQGARRQAPLFAIRVHLGSSFEDKQPVKVVQGKCS